MCVGSTIGQARLGSLEELLADDPGVVKVLVRVPGSRSDDLLARARPVLSRRRRADPLQRGRRDARDLGPWREQGVGPGSAGRPSGHRRGRRRGVRRHAQRRRDAAVGRPVLRHGRRSSGGRRGRRRAGAGRASRTASPRSSRSCSRSTRTARARTELEPRRLRGTGRCRAGARSRRALAARARRTPGASVPASRPSRRDRRGRPTGGSWWRMPSSCIRAAICWATSAVWIPWNRPSSQPTSWAWAIRSSASVGVSLAERQRDAAPARRPAPARGPARARRSSAGGSRTSRARPASSSGAPRTSSSSCLIMLPIRITLAGCSTCSIGLGSLASPSGRPSAPRPARPGPWRPRCPCRAWSRPRPGPPSRPCSRSSGHPAPIVGCPPFASRARLAGMPVHTPLRLASPRHCSCPPSRPVRRRAGSRGSRPPTMPRRPSGWLRTATSRSWAGRTSPWATSRPTSGSTRSGRRSSWTRPARSGPGPGCWTRRPAGRLPTFTSIPASRPSRPIGWPRGAGRSCCRGRRRWRSDTTGRPRPSRSAAWTATRRPSADCSPSASSGCAPSGG